MNGNTKSRGGLLLTVCAVLFAAVFSFALLGCDSDPGDDSPTTPEGIRGTWVISASKFDIKIGEKSLERGEWSGSTFTGNGTEYKYNGTVGKYHRFDD